MNKHEKNIACCFTGHRKIPQKKYIQIQEKDKKVLLVDTDNQSHLSRFLGYDGTDGKPTISELIWQTVSKVQKPVSEAIRKSELGVDYIPSNFMLAGIISILGTDSDSTGVFSRLFSDGAFSRAKIRSITLILLLTFLLSTKRERKSMQKTGEKHTLSQKLWRLEIMKCPFQ